MKELDQNRRPDTADTAFGHLWSLEGHGARLAQGVDCQRGTVGAELLSKIMKVKYRLLRLLHFERKRKPRFTVRSWISNLAFARAAFTKLLLLHKEQWWNARQKSFSSGFWKEDHASRCRASSASTWQTLGMCWERNRWQTFEDSTTW